MDLPRLTFAEAGLFLILVAAPLASFMQPTAFAGDFQQPEQRVGQVGFRLTF